MHVADRHIYNMFQVSDVQYDIIDKLKNYSDRAHNGDNSI